jgi:hypothetical protein
MDVVPNTEIQCKSIQELQVSGDSSVKNPQEFQVSGDSLQKNPQELQESSTQESQISTRPSDFMSYLATLMADPIFRGFYREYFATWSDSKASLMLIKAYLMIEHELSKRTDYLLPDHMNTDIDPHIVIEILQKLMKHSQYRHYLVQSMDLYMKNEQDFTHMFNELVWKDTDKLSVLRGACP